ncbi:MFS transporter [Actinoallomurus spadix]|uniref:MFS transporter n=1 Tax=Actinoallomurus spadix TaxID=79912 RepID=A0ABN0XB27_9ACTN|nr:MFS transporter [Actinoallomurus spadix]MCO5987785.1 MFS transporter [Actinoallomurus spadix]
MTATDESRAGVGTPAVYRWRWAALFVILAAEVMDMLDAMITSIAAPSIRADLGGSASIVQWLGAAYTLAMAVGLITGGRLGDVVGRKRMFVIGAVGFTAGSLLCALAQSPETLIAFRGLQGLFGAVMLPQGLGMIKEMFSEEEMSKAFGAFGPVMGLSSVGGPILAGWLIDADLFGTGWRMIFLINLPLGLLAVLGGLRFLPATRSTEAPRLDLAGVVLAALASLLLIYPLVQGRELGWPTWAFAMIAAGVAVFGLFGWYEARTKRAGGDPLVVPSLFHKRGYTGGLIVGTVFFSGMAGFSLVFSLFLQIGLGYSPLRAGLATVPWSAGVVIGFGVAQAVQRYGRRVIHGGTVVMALGVAAVVLTLHLAGTGVGPWDFVPALTLTGTGMGVLMAPFFDIVLAGVEPHETGSASGTLTAVQQFGSALGVAVLGTIFFGVLGGEIASATDTTAPKTLAAAGVSGPARDRLVAGLRDCGHDRAVAKDTETVPASCLRAEGEVRAAGVPAQRAAAEAGRTAVKSGFVATMKIVLWVEVGLLGLTFLAAFLLPRRARDPE